mmetsp:Transcript_10550/g.18675  ORF Transcript_10550/g.18675 Transcript_10550/m.18675 type:complete len:292 (-) Transcript_10550:209-1084(-)
MIFRVSLGLAWVPRRQWSDDGPPSPAPPSLRPVGLTLQGAPGSVPRSLRMDVPLSFTHSPPGWLENLPSVRDLWSILPEQEERLREERRKRLQEKRAWMRESFDKMMIDKMIDRMRLIEREREERQWSALRHSSLLFTLLWLSDDQLRWKHEEIKTFALAMERLSKRGFPFCPDLLLLISQQYKPERRWMVRLSQQHKPERRWTVVPGREEATMTALRLAFLNSLCLEYLVAKVKYYVAKGQYLGCWEEQEERQRLWQRQMPERQRRPKPLAVPRRVPGRQVKRCGFPRKR